MRSSIFQHAIVTAVPLLACPGSTAPSAQRVQQLLAGLEQGKFAHFWGLFYPEATWNTIGFGVRQSRADAMAIFDQIDCLLANPPLKIETDMVISQGTWGPYTAVQAHVPNGIVGTNGVQYNQTYMWLLKWQGERIVSNTEYLDDVLGIDLIGDNANNC